jgi:hypothetical protein
VRKRCHPLPYAGSFGRFRYSLRHCPILDRHVSASVHHSILLCDRIFSFFALSHQKGGKNQFFVGVGTINLRSQHTIVSAACL